MIFSLTLISILITNVSSKTDNDFIVDYFEYKKTSRVVGFSCNYIEDDLLLVKDLNKLNVAVALNKLNEESEIRSFANTQYWRLGIFLDIRCFQTDRTAENFLEATNHRMFDELRLWLVLGNELEKVLEIIDDRAFGLSTDFVIAVRSEQDLQYHFYDVYNMSKERGGTLKFTFLGEWNQKYGINVKLTVPKFLRRSNLQGLKLKAIFFKSPYRPPNMTQEEYYQDYTNSTKDGLTKYGFIINKILSELFNYSLQCLETPKWKEGDHVGPIVRALNNNEVDFTGSSLTMNIFRTHVIKFTHQEWPFRTCFVFRNPQLKNIKVGEVLGPLSDDTWYLTGLFLLLSMLTLTFLFQFEYTDSNLTRFSDSFMLTIGALCQQGTNLKMEFSSTRIAFFFILLTSYLLYNYYSSSIVSARLNQPIFKINDSLVELGKLELKMASEWMIYLDFFLKKPEWETKTFYHTRWLQIPEEERIMAPEKGIKLVKKGGFAYHMHPEVGYPYIDRTFDNHAVCQLMEVHLVRPTLSTMATTMNSSFNELAKVGLTKISEVGIRRRQLNKWQYKKPRCQKNVLSAASIDLYEFAPHLVLLLLGFIFAFFIYTAEIICTRTRFSLSANSSLLYKKNNEEKLKLSVKNDFK